MTTTANPEPGFQRIYSFDLLRIFFVFAIVMLHAWEHFVGEDLASAYSTPTNYLVYQQWVGTVFNYAALYALSLSFLLWGMKDFKLRKVKIFVFALGMIGLQLRNPSEPFNFESWSWEVYGFLFVAVAICRFWPRRVAWAIFLWTASILMLSISMNVWIPIADQTVEPWRTIFFANRETSATIGWFLIPWIFVPTLAYTSGLLLRMQPVWHVRLIRFAYATAGILVIISLFLYWLKADPVPPMLAEHFYQFLFMQSPSHFWNHYLFFAATVILCLKWESKGFLSKSPLRYLSYLQWNRNFFLCYFFHFSIIVFLLRWKDEIRAQPYLLDWLWMIIFVSTEILMQLFVGALKIYARLGKWFFKSLRTKEAA